MDYYQSFSSLNERLRPRVTSSHQLYSSLSRLEDRQTGSIRSLSSNYRPTILPSNQEPRGIAAAEDPEEPGDRAERLVHDDLPEGRCVDQLSCHISELNLKDMGDEEMDDDGGAASPSEEKDIPGELTSKKTAESSESAGDEGESPFQRSYEDGSLPDLIRSGRPLGRRRTLGHVSETLKEVRREVELSRRRSIKLKAQVDKLQESREGLGWSQHRERVTEEVMSVLRLLRPLTETDSGTPEPSQGENSLDDALAQLQNVARKLAFSHTKQKSTSGTGAEQSAILQQALCDRDEAIEKKKAMEAELLRSKTELMSLNNQLLEAVQKRLELSLEVEAWKEDFQLLMQQQVQIQQQAEQAQKKPSRMGLLRRHNKPLTQRPASITVSAPTPPTTNSGQIFISRSAVSAPSALAPRVPSPSTQRNWMDKLRRGKSSRQEQEAAAQDSEWGGQGDNSFHVISLD